MQDLLFAAQSRRSLTRWREVYASHGEPGITFARLTYTGQEDEVVGKALDFSGATVDARWRKGREQAETFLGAIGRGDVALGGSGLRIHAG